MSESLTEKIFWPIVVVAVLALGGFGWFFVSLTSRPQWQDPAATVAVSDKPVTPSTPAPPTEKPPAEAAPAAPEFASPSEGEPEMAAPAEEESPYMVPGNKPFLTRDDFIRKNPPPKPGAKPPLKKPLPPGTPAAKTPGATTPDDKKRDVLSLIDHRKVVVLNSGRKIIATSVVDLGDSYGIKDDKQQTLTVKKDDVTRIERP